VRIDEPGEGIQPGGVHHLGIRLGDVGRDVGNFAVLYQYVQRLEFRGDGVKYHRPLD